MTVSVVSQILTVTVYIYFIMFLFRTFNYAVQWFIKFVVFILFKWGQYLFILFLINNPWLIKLAEWKSNFVHLYDLFPFINALKVFLIAEQ